MIEDEESGEELKIVLDLIMSINHWIKMFIIDEEVDSLRFYYLGNQYKTKVEHIGVDKGIAADGILIL